MEVHLKPELQAKLDRLASETGRPPDELVADAMAGYLDELVGVCQVLDGRFGELKCGKVKPIDGEQFFEGLRRREDELLDKPSPQ